MLVLLIYYPPYLYFSFNQQLHLILVFLAKLKYFFIV